MPCSTGTGIHMGHYALLYISRYYSSRYLRRRSFTGKIFLCVGANTIAPTEDHLGGKMESSDVSESSVHFSIWNLSGCLDLIRLSKTSYGLLLVLPEFSHAGHRR